MVADVKEKTLTQRQTKRLEWWKKYYEADDLSKTDSSETSGPAPKRKLKAPYVTESDFSIPAPKKSKIECLKEDSGLANAAVRTLGVANTKKNSKLRKDKPAQPDEGSAPKKSKVESLKEESDLAKTAVGILSTAKAKNKPKTAKDKATQPDSVVASKKSKIESLKEESGLADMAVGTLCTAKAKKKSKNRKRKTTKPAEGDDANRTPSESNKSKLAKNLKAYVLFVGGIANDVTKEDIEKHFARTGGVKEVRLLTDKNTGKSKGCAYIDFVDSKSHRFALRLHESTLGGRKINVEFTSRGRKTPKRTERLREKNRRMARMKRVFYPAARKDH